MQITPSPSPIRSTSNSPLDALGPASSREKPAREALCAEDEWLGTLSKPTRRVAGTPFFLSRVGPAVEPPIHESRLNSHGYNQDDPQDAMSKYEALHKPSLLTRASEGFSNLVFDMATFFVPKALSISAGPKKQRIDQAQVLRIVRESVDAFPELKIRVSKDEFAAISSEDQMKWREQMSIIRAAQHEFIIQELMKLYPHHINQDAPTILYTGGRATGLLRVLYCSVDEYIALYWSDWGLASTDSGSYKAHVYDYITEGQNINWKARYLDGAPENYEITEPGEYTFLGRGDRKIWSFEGPCGMVDHGIGDVISMAKFAMVSNITSTLNFHAIGSLISTQARAVVHEYAVRLKENFGCTDVSAHPTSRVDELKFAEARAYFARIVEKF